MDNNPSNRQPKRVSPSWDAKRTNEAVGHHDGQDMDAPESRSLLWLLLIAGILAIILALWLSYEYFLVKGDLEKRESVAHEFRKNNSSPEQTGGLVIEEEALLNIPPSFEPEVEIIPEVPVPQPEITLPALEESDTLVKENLPPIMPGVKLERWLASTHLIRKFVMLVDNIAAGKLPRKHFKFLAPKGRFLVENRSGDIYLDPRGYDRYRYVAELFDALDETTAAQLYFKLEPLLQAAYEELGYPDSDFTKRLLKAISQIQKTPVLEGKIELVQPSVKYKFARRKLEKLNPVQKQMLRMGPDTIEIIQRKSLAFAKTLSTKTAYRKQKKTSTSIEKKQ
ncbi:MAG: DUF3014 domain-containing protein [Methylococcales bacterium]